MAENFPGPYVLKLNYIVTSTPGGAVSHTLQLNVDPVGVPSVGMLFSSIPVESRDASQAALDSVVETLIGLIGHQFNSAATDFVSAELWRVEPLSTVMTWVSEYTPVATWTNTTGVFEASQAIFSFRTQEGGVMFIHLLDGVGAPAVTNNYTDLTTENKAFADYVLAAGTSWFLAKDTSYPIAFLKLNQGVNESVFKRRYRP